MVVELGKIREFARATKSRNPAYDGGPGDAPVSPGTFLITQVFWQTPASDPFAGIERDLERTLHGEQRFEFIGPPPKAGDVLTCSSRIARIYEKVGRRGGTMRFADMVTEFRDRRGHLVATSTIVTIETSKPTSES